ncbi:MAG TPA: hypothetical protein VG604_01310 [Candidatus Saccharimonadales bacterium]|nr:hypothetical protein [Candidatus Saccharimonadales bacterium]
MTGVNHGLTGGLIGKLLPLPLVIPVAFVSHFVLDMLPHYGISHKKRDRSMFWKVFFTLDTLATLGLAIYAVAQKHYTMFLGGLAATMPDYVWVAHVISTRSFNLSSSKNRFSKWHASIQGLERPWGLWIELPLTAILFYIVMIRLW